MLLLCETCACTVLAASAYLLYSQLQPYLLVNAHLVPLCSVPAVSCMMSN